MVINPACSVTGIKNDGFSYVRMTICDRCRASCKTPEFYDVSIAEVDRHDWPDMLPGLWKYIGELGKLRAMEISQSRSDRFSKKATLSDARSATISAPGMSEYPGISANV